jgi:hypothetical protein
MAASAASGDVTFFERQRREAIVFAKMIKSPEFTTFCGKHPEVKPVIALLAPEYLALRQKALYLDTVSAGADLKTGLLMAPLCWTSNLLSMHLLRMLRHVLLRYETLRECDAMELANRYSNALASKKKTVAALLQLATTITKSIQNASAPRERIGFVVTPTDGTIMMEAGMFAAARRRCMVCAKPGILRCSRCGLVWHCSKACQIAHWGPRIDTAIASDVKQTKTTSRVPFGGWHRQVCAGPAVDRAVFRAAQRILADGFKTIEFDDCATVVFKPSESGKPKDSSEKSKVKS